MHHGLPGSIGIFYTFEGEAKTSIVVRFLSAFLTPDLIFQHFSDAKKCQHPTAALKYDVFSSCLMFFCKLCIYLWWFAQFRSDFFLVLFVSLTGLRRGIHTYIKSAHICIKYKHIHMYVYVYINIYANMYVYICICMCKTQDIKA